VAPVAVKTFSVEEVSTPHGDLHDWLKTEVTDQMRAPRVLFNITPHISVLRPRPCLSAPHSCELF
jgi:hypothetical protein